MMGRCFSIDCTAVEKEVANSMYQRSELDWLIYNDPLGLCRTGLEWRPGTVSEGSDRKNFVRLAVKQIR